MTALRREGETGMRRQGGRLWGALALLVLLALLAGGAPAQAEDKPEVLYFYENYCGSCTPELDFEEEFALLTGQDLKDFRYRAYNVRNAANRALYEEALDQYQVPEEQRLLPLVLAAGKVYSGATQIAQALPADFLENRSTDSVLYYLYTPSCQSCAQAKQTLDALPETLRVTRGSYSFDSRVVVVPVNIYEQLGVAQALFERHGVPERDQIAPSVFLRDSYLSGAERIEKLLAVQLERGAAVGTPLLDEGAAGASVSALSWAGAATAGLVAGFNPCALSMLLFFLALLMPAGRRVWRYAVLYLAVKFGAYLAIGTVLLSLLSAWNPTWLPLAAKLLLTVLGGALVALNLWDAFSAHHQRYGQIKNQLPQGVRRFLHERMRGALEQPGRRLGLTVALVGFIVALSEFLCSGQLYLATLTAGLESGVAYGRMLGMLLVFCLMFLAPSAVLAALVIKGRELVDLSEWMRARMPAVKLATALVMLAAIAVAWLL